MEKALKVWMCCIDCSTMSGSAFKPDWRFCADRGDWSSRWFRSCARVKYNCGMRTITTLLVCFAVCIFAHGQSKLDAPSITQVNQKVSDFMTKTGAPGVSVAIV